jgi:uncharacterized protein
MARSDQRRGRTGYTNVVGIPSSWRTYNHSLRLLDSDESEAFRLNQVAAQEGMHDAVLAMGWFYLNGVGVEIDQEAALRWYRKSARQGDARAMFSLGQIAYLDGDYTEALLWFTRAAYKGHYRSEFWLGKLYWRGRGVGQDRRTAYKHFVKAAEKKLPEAQRTLRYLGFIANHTEAK